MGADSVDLAEAEALVNRRNRWSVLFTLLVAVGGLLAVIFLRGGEDAVEARELWDAEAPAAYEWEYQAGGRVVEPPRFRVAVRNGEVMEAELVGGDPAFAARPAIDVAWAIEDLFAAIDSYEPEHREVSYDAALGYPSRGTADDPDTVDDEWDFEVFDFVVLES